MQELNKTKAALPGRQCHYTKQNHSQLITPIDQVKLTAPLAQFDLVSEGIPPMGGKGYPVLAHTPVEQASRCDYVRIAGGTQPVTEFGLVRILTEGGIPPTVLENTGIPAVTFYSIRGKVPVAVIEGYPALTDTPIVQHVASSLALRRCSPLRTTLIDLVNNAGGYREFYPVTGGVSQLVQHMNYGSLVVQKATSGSFADQTFGLQSAFNWYLICFSWSLNFFLSSSSSAFKALYFSVRPLTFISEVADSSCCESFKFAGKIEPGLPVISAALCLQSTLAGHSHVIPIWPATSKTTTLYRSVLLLLSAENVYSMTFLRSDILVWVIGGQLFDSLLSRFKRCQQASFTQELNWPSAAASSTFWSRSSSNRMIFLVLFERSVLFLAFFSCIGSYRYVRFILNGMNHFICEYHKKQRPVVLATHTGRLTKPLYEVTIMADIKSTQTRPKFTFLFLAIYPDGGRPTVLRIDADTEQEARLKIEGTDFTLIFAAQIRTESPLHFHRIDLDSGRIELMHQRYQASPEVRHV